MKTKPKKVHLLLALLSVICLYAQQINLPFKLSKDNRSIFIKLPVENQKDSLLFFFDTGAGTTLLDKKIAQKLNLKAKYKTEIRGAGGKKLYDVLTNQKIFLDRSHYIDSTNIVLDDLSRLNVLFEQKFDGIIGASILKKYLTKIDFETHTISLYKFDNFSDYTGYQKLPFEFYSGIPKLPITFELKNKEKFSGDILFDSGAGLSLLVNSPYKEKNKLLNKIDEKITLISNNLSNKTNYEKGLIKSITLGNTRFENKNLDISLASDKEGVSSAEDILGILGSEIIYRFNIILDYKNKNIYLKPNYLFHENFEELVSPISLKYSDDRKEIIISNVLQNTDAYKKGLREGQRIISINNIQNKDIHFYSQVLKRKNKKILIKYIDNDNKVKSVKFKLKKLL
ncbi:aspartyl protease family protein [Elizabethkingia bruuniana]|uniref:aspartyl protease family protein n=1 Tax=Elizabethkingia bruuniana TaxID=1756149 RepID=UPI00241DC624|nr:aspartyl protease family protein [Elizabethkingia bruuniana]